MTVKTMRIHQISVTILIQLFCFGSVVTNALFTPVRLKNSDHYIQIGDREPYNAHLTSFSFPKPICVIGLEVQTLQPLTGAEDIEITYSICADVSTTSNSSWTLAHYTNKKNVFVLRKPILARSLAIVAGIGRGTTAATLSVLNVNIKQCDTDFVFGPEGTEHFIAKSESICPTTTQSTKHHTHRHRHGTGNNVLRVSDMAYDQLLLAKQDFGSDLTRFNRSKRSVTFDGTQNNKNARQTGFAVENACPPGYHGPSCTAIDCTSVRNCSNSGTCIAPNTCKCAPNYFGPDCSQCSGWFCNQCDFYCVHGQCDAITRSCSCRSGWSGAACDVCLNGTNCEILPLVTLILPQTAESENQNDYVYVHGRDFPQGNGRYHCLFGGISTAGNWLSSDLLRCGVPRRARPGKHVFSVVPFGASNFLPNIHGKTQHFTFYDSCKVDSCHGSCLGPLCICNQTTFGDDCSLLLSRPSRRNEILSDSSITIAQEGEPYIISIPIDATSRIAEIKSEISSELVADPFKHTLTWHYPRGRATPYEMAVNIVDDNMDLGLKWNLTVSPSYIPIIGKIEQGEFGNSWNLKGFVEAVNGSWVPPTPQIKLEILSSNEQNIVFDSMTINSINSTNFQQQLYPYAGSSTAALTYTLRARHPGQSEDAMTNCATWKYKKLFVASLDRNIISINNVSHATGLFSTNSIDLNCQSFDVFVITNTRKVQIVTWSFVQQNIGRIEVTFSVTEDGTANKKLRDSINSIIGFRCGTDLSASVQILFDSSNPASNSIQINPSSIFVYSNQLTTLNIEFSNVRSRIASALITSANILPFYVVASSPTDYSNVNSYKNGSVLKLTLGVFGANGNVTQNGFLRLPSVSQPMIEIPYSIRPPASESLELVIMPLGFVAPQPAKDYPLEVSLYSVNGIIALKRIVHLNVRSEFYPLSPDFYRISIRSLAFQSFDTVHNLRPENNTVTVFLHKKTSNLVVVDGQDVRIDRFPISTSDASVEPVAEVILSPSHFNLADIDRDIFVNVVYSQGPFNSTALINFKKIPDPTTEFIIVTFDDDYEPLCVGCGLRHKIQITKNPNFIGETDSSCSIFRGSIPFNYVVDRTAMDFVGEAVYIVDLRKSQYEPVKLCQQDVSPLPEVTTVLFDCAAARLAECRRYYVPIQSCGSTWKQIPDDVISIHVYALFLKMQHSCANNGVDFQQFETLIECINALDADCPVTRPLPATESNVPTTQSSFVSMLNQMNAIKPLTQPLSNYFPALSTVESQLVNLPSQMGSFINSFKRVFSPLSTLMNSSEFFDSFWKNVDDNSPGGAAIVETELSQMPTFADSANIIARWNETNELLTGERTNIVKNYKITALRQLIDNADRLKGLARQFGATNPFEMFYEVQSGLFSRTGYSPNASEPVAKVLGTVEPYHLHEKDEFDVNVVITNVMSSAFIDNIKLQLEILQTHQNQVNSTRIGYRIGPLFYSGGTPDRITPENTLTATWKVQPIFERRLSKSIKLKPNVIMLFDLANRRRIQRLAVPIIEIKPQRHLRVFAMAYPTVNSQPLPENQPFSLALFVMNSGFSNLKNLRFPLLAPQLLKTANSRAVEYRIHGVAVNNEFAAYTPDIVIPLLPSGKSTIISMNMSTLGSEVANFVNCSIAITSDDDLLDFLDFRFFRIKEAVNNDGYVLSDGDPNDDRSITYHFDTRTTKLNALHNVQLVEKTESNESTNEGTTSFVTTATFQRLLDHNQLTLLANPQSLKQMTSTIIGKIQFPEDSVPPNYELVRLTEVSASGERRHNVALENAWVTVAGDTKELNFVDEAALPPALASQLYYEFVFGRRAEFNAPFFAQTAYSTQIYPEMIPETNVVVTKVDAVSPVGQKLEYDLVGTDETAVNSFAINKNTGEIILTTNELPAFRPSKSAVCFNIIAKDKNGRRTVTPLLIQLPIQGMNLTSDTYCNVFSSATPVKHHQFNGDRSVLKTMRFDTLSTNKIGVDESEADFASTVSTVVPTGETLSPPEGMNTDNTVNVATTVESTSMQNQTPSVTETSTTETSTVVQESSVVSTTVLTFTPNPNIVAQMASEATQLNEKNGWQLITPVPGRSGVESQGWRSTSEGMVLPQFPDEFEIWTPGATQFVDETTTPFVDFSQGFTINNGVGVILPSTPTASEGHEFTVDPSGLTQQGFEMTTENTKSDEGNEGANVEGLEAIVEPSKITPINTETREQGATETLFPEATTLTEQNTVPPTFVTHPDTLPISQTTGSITIKPTESISEGLLSTVSEPKTVEASTLNPQTISESVTALPPQITPIPTPALILQSTPASSLLSPLPADMNVITTVPMNAITPTPPTQSLIFPLGSSNEAGLMTEESDMRAITSTNSETMTKIACRLRDTKPIWAIICDMAKTVSKTTA